MSGSNILTGRVWKFGDNISTDLIMPSFGAMSSPNMDPHEAALFCMRANRPDWAEKVRPGDIVIAGKNFGCGSSRPAAKMLKGLGIQLVVAESVARIFFRNSINLGMAILSCPGVHDAFEEGETIEVNMETGEIRSLDTGRTIRGEALPSDSPPAQLLRAGGVDVHLQQCGRSLLRRHGADVIAAPHLPRRQQPRQCHRQDEQHRQSQQEHVRLCQFYPLSHS